MTSWNFLSIVFSAGQISGRAHAEPVGDRDAKILYTVYRP